MADWLDGVSRDVRYAFRSLRRAPGFVAIAVFCLALGIGANAAIFSVINAVLLKPMPFREPERLVRMYEAKRDKSGFTGSVSVPNFRDWKAQSRSFERMVAYQSASRNLLGAGGEPERISVVESTADLFPMLGVPALLGRGFAEGEDQPGKGNVAVLGEGMWRRRFGADPSVLGKSVSLDGTVYSIIGVMPERFSFPPGARPADVWLPLVPSEQTEKSRGSHMLAVVGRLRPGVTMGQASDEMRRIAAGIERQYPNEQTLRTVLLYPLREVVVGRARPALLILFGAVGMVLLIACANVANLLLARAATRRHEVAVRLALGASRGRLVRQFLVESVVLALAGAVLGALFAWWGLEALRPLAERALPLAGGVPLDRRVFGFLLAVATLSGIAFGLLPALASSSTDVREHLSESGVKSTASGGQQRSRSLLVVAEVALSLVLLAGAGLLLRGFLLLRNTEPGLAPENVLTAHVAIPTARYATENEARDRLIRPIVQNVRAIPGVRSAAAISMLPIQNAWTNGGYSVVGKPAPQPGKEPWAEWRVTTPGFFQSLGIPVKVGRDFTEQDGDSGKEVIVINEVLARREFKDANPIGQQFNVGGSPHAVIGVVGAIRQAGLDQQPLPEIYFPYTEGGTIGWLRDMTLVIKTTVPPEGIVAQLRQAVRAADPTQPIFQVATMREVIATSLADRRMTLSLLAVFATIALLLAAAGLYGVIAYLVAQRTREIGIRVALGAQKRDVLRLMMRHGASLTAAGIALGLVGSVALTRLLQSLLFGVSARDPVTFLSVAAVLAAVALLATYFPARRATRVDPMVALRGQ
ncbi:MAG TPA: ABC transporter permease [Gemmatimonadaceae bacterium]|nr:ABC transporter permease [Gemmatimonadaceae bacterium]